MNIPYQVSHRSLQVFPALGVTAAAVTIALVLAANGSGQVSGARTIKLFEAPKGGTFGFVDNAPKTSRKDPHASIGDILAFRNPIFDGSRKHRLGVSSAQCIATRAGRIASATYTCSGTFAVNDGTIAVAALQRGEPTTQQLAVTGGTGAYNGARGTIVARMLKSGTEDTITLLP
jgi:allene oxide cyclase